MIRYQKTRVVPIPLPPNLPLAGLDKEAQSALKAIQLPYPKPSASLAERFVVHTWDQHWRLALHWFYKIKLNSRHRVPGEKPEWSWAKPFGEVLVALFNLCEAIHSTEIQYSQAYPNAWEWFRLVCSDLRTLERNRFFSREPRSNSKTQYQREARILLASLRAHENPESRTLTPHLWAMTEAGVEICRTYCDPIFNLQLWVGIRRKRQQKGYIHSLSNFHRYNALPNGWKPYSWFIEDGKLLVKTGRGNQILEITPEQMISG